MPSSPTHGHGTLSSVTMQSVQYLVDDAFPVRFDRPQARVGIPIPNVVCAQLLTQMVDMRDPVAAIGSRSEGILVGTPEAPLGEILIHPSCRSPVEIAAQHHWQMAEVIRLGIVLDEGQQFLCLPYP